jgi:hypothetical protein
MIYIVRDGNGYIERVDEYKDTQRFEATLALKEYRLSDPDAFYYLRDANVIVTTGGEQ